MNGTPRGKAAHGRAAVPTSAGGNGRSDGRSTPVDAEHTPRDGARFIGHEVSRQGRDVARLHELAERYGGQPAFDVTGNATEGRSPTPGRTAVDEPVASSTPPSAPKCGIAARKVSSTPVRFTAKTRFH